MNGYKYFIVISPNQISIDGVPEGFEKGHTIKDLAALLIGDTDITSAKCSNKKLHKHNVGYSPEIDDYMDFIAIFQRNGPTNDLANAIIDMRDAPRFSDGYKGVAGTAIIAWATIASGKKTMFSGMSKEVAMNTYRDLKKYIEEKREGHFELAYFND